MRLHDGNSQISQAGLDMGHPAQPSLSINDCEYFEGFDELDAEGQLESFEKALYKVKGGFGASRRGGPQAFYKTIDEVRDQFT